MLFWIVAALLTCTVVVGIVWPLRQSATERRDPASETEADVNVYVDQLAEVDADLARGTIAPAEAEAAKVEISRRMLAAANERPKPRSGPRDHLVRVVAIACGVLIPLIAVAGYVVFGAPGAPDAPRAARLKMPVDQMPVAELVARVEARLRETPNDGQGWDVIAPIYMRLNRLEDAREAFRRAIELLGESEARLRGLARVTIALAQGTVTPEAEALYRKLAQRDPESVEAVFSLALAKEQAGQFEDAKADYEALLARATDASPWREAVSDRLAAVSRQLTEPPNVSVQGQSGTGPASPDTAKDAPAPAGPSNADVAASARMDPQDRLAMIRNMVDGLAARLSENGSDPEGWRRLIRSYVVLGERERAVDALGRAQVALRGSPEELDELERFVGRFGVGPHATSERRPSGNLDAIKPQD